MYVQRKIKSTSANDSASTTYVASVQQTTMFMVQDEFVMRACTQLVIRRET